MAKLFADKFNLDKLPEPTMPVKHVNQGEVAIVNKMSKDAITNPDIQVEKIKAGDRIVNPNIKVEKIEPTSIDSQKMNARLHEIQNQKGEILTSDEILERQGVKKNSATQYVSSVKPEPFGTNPPNQGSTDIKLPKEIDLKSSTVEVKKVGDSVITDPKIEVQKVDQGSKITDPKIQVSKVNADEMIVNPDTPIKLVDIGEKTTNPNTIINKIKPGDRITDPNIQPALVNANELIVNPNIQPLPAKDVNPISFIPDNTKGIGDTKIFPRTISLKDRLQQGNLGTTRHLPEYILSDQNTGFITIKNPKVVEITSKIDVQKTMYMNTILKQGGVEDIMKGIVSITNPFKFGEDKPNQGSIVIKNSQTTPKKPSPVQIKKVNPNEMIVDPKLEITKVVPGERTTDPNTKPNRIVPGERTFDPKTVINPVKPGERTFNPETKIVPVQPGERTFDPQLKIDPVVPGERTFDPDIKIKRVVADELIINPNLQIPLVKPGERTVDPKTEIIPVIPGERTTDPKLVIPLVKPGERTIDPKLQIPIVKPGERTVDPNLQIKRVKPGSRTFDPQTVIVPIVPGDRITVVENRLTLFPQVDNKFDFVQEPFYFLSDTEIYQSALTTDIINIPDFQTLGYFVSDVNLNSSRTSETLSTDDPMFAVANQYGVTRVPQFIKDAGISYGNQYNNKSPYVKSLTKELLTGPSPLTEAAQDAESAITLTHKTSIEGAIAEEAKPVLFPAQEYGDASLPGGYRALSYGQIQKRAKEPGKYSNRDYTYSDEEPTLRPWRERLGMPDKGADTINQSINSEVRDLVTIKFESNRDGLTLQFRSYLKAFSDSYSPTFSDINYIGRPDTLKVFKGTSRQISVGFIVPVLSESELKVVYQKLESLVKIGTMGKKTSSIYMQGPFVLLTIGGWCKRTPIVFNSLKFDTQITDYSWDIMKEVPQIVDVSLDCIALSDNTGTGYYTEGTFIQYGAQ